MDEKLERVDEGLDKLVPMIMQRERFDDPEKRKGTQMELITLMLKEIARLVRIMEE